MDRRKFLQTAGTALLGAVTPSFAAVEKRGGVPYRVLGRTGEHVSLVGIGGSHLSSGGVWESTAIKIVRTALDNGVNFLDNSWDYGRGASEERMGKALLDGYRAKAFLMTKLDGRTAASASQQLDESLRRLQTDHVDLLQVHEVIRMSDPERIFGLGGTMEAIRKAKQAGKLRYIGFTGHKSPEIHLHMLEVARQHGFHFDTVQMPLNVMDAHFDSFEKKVLPVLVERNIGVLGMKSMASGNILKSKTVTALECLRYTMSLPVSVCITGCDSIKILQQALDVARNFQPLTRGDIAVLRAKTANVAANGQFEPYKVSDQFDTTTHFPESMG